MAKDPQAVGSDKAELKKWLNRAATNPVHMAFIFGKDGKAVVKLDGMKPGRALEKSLQDGMPDAKNGRFGTVQIDSTDPDTVKFIVNKAVSGAARKLTMALKGSGFAKVEIVLEDGTSVETAAGGADGDEDGAPAPPNLDGAPAPPNLDGAPAAPNLGSAPAAPEPPATPDKPAAPVVPPPPSAPADPAALTVRLTALVKQMMGAIQADPSRKAALAGLAGQIQANLKGGDLAQAASGLEALSAALGAGAGAAAPAPPAPAAPAPPQPTPAPPAGKSAHGVGSPVFAKARTAWEAARQKVEEDVGKLHSAMTSTYQGHGFSADLDKYFKAKIDPVLAQLDSTLTQKLDEVTSNTDPAKHTQLVQEAKQMVAGIESFVTNDKLIANLDDNPFIPLAIQKTLTATLGALSKAIT